MTIVAGPCPVCNGPLDRHSFRDIRITKKLIVVRLEYAGNPPCEFVGMIIS